MKSDIKCCSITIGENTIDLAYWTLAHGQRMILITGSHGISDWFEWNSDSYISNEGCEVLLGAGGNSRSYMISFVDILCNNLNIIDKNISNVIVGLGIPNILIQDMKYIQDLIKECKESLNKMIK